MSEKPLTETQPTVQAARPIPKQPTKPAAAERLRSELPSMKTAVLWSEILGKPLSRRGRK